MADIAQAKHRGGPRPNSGRPRNELIAELIAREGISRATAYRRMQAAKATVEVGEVMHGDCRKILPAIPNESIDCIVTSPPYWGLRDYGVEGQIGVETTLDEYLETMVQVCRELWRVLKPTGSFWLNVGDCYANIGNTHQTDFTSSAVGYGGRGRGVLGGQPRRRIPTRLKAKNLCMIPNRIALLLQQDGWFVRSEIIWHKPNGMPESIIDRPTSAHEKVWLLTKSDRYFYDADAIRRSHKEKSLQRAKQARGRDHKYSDERQPIFQDISKCCHPNGSNARNVWTIGVNHFKDTHFATFPPELVRRCILAGCPPGGLVLDPFGGSGTTGLVAKQLGRRAALIEINPDYVKMAKDRLGAY